MNARQDFITEFYLTGFYFLTENSTSYNNSQILIELSRVQFSISNFSGKDPSGWRTPIFLGHVESRRYF